MTLASPFMAGIPFLQSQQVSGRNAARRASIDWNRSNVDRNCRRDKLESTSPPVFAKIRWKAAAGRSNTVMSARAALAAGPGCSERLVHDLLDGARTPSALRAATEATINLARGARGRASRDGRPHVMVAEHVAGAHDHRSNTRQLLVRSETFVLEFRTMGKANPPILHVFQSDHLAR